jgi:alkanesulfonate monooxygenase SsuD/methylene tetrahydromethanopterin reductase-like flavin-dependent oxidoreductase (luciferase family)
MRRHLIGMRIATPPEWHGKHYRIALIVRTTAPPPPRPPPWRQSRSIGIGLGIGIGHA